MVKGGGGAGPATEYTPIGDCRFLAYIPSEWKNQPWLVRVGGARPPPFSLLPPSTKLQCSVRSSLEGTYTLRISSLPLYVLCDLHSAMCTQNTSYITPDLIQLVLMTTGTMKFKGIVSRDVLFRSQDLSKTFYMCADVLLLKKIYHNRLFCFLLYYYLQI